ncbi:MAG: nucleotidyltransferase domain-containing protein [Acidobacteriota bacterium]|nr:nucleotidyltransferase domain-containing protein [Acidobacteriota bacterium]
MTDIFENLAEVFDADKRLDAAYVLGSAARGELRASSDIDIALLPAPGAALTACDLAELAGRLADIAGRPVDLGILSSRNLVYAHQAILTGKCVWRRAETSAGLRIATLLGLYDRFQFERREVLDAYTAG